jgi:hypothetical protein
MKVTLRNFGSNFDNTNAATTSVRQMLGGVILSILFSASMSQSFAAGRVFQVLGACNGGQAEFIGNVKKGRSQLTSLGPNDIAGFFYEGIEGQTIGSLRNAQALFEVPADASTYEVVIRVKVTGKPNKIQNFYVAGHGHEKLPNLPVRPLNGDQSQLSLAFVGQDLLVEGSKLSAEDTVEKISFIFHSTEKVQGSAIQCHIDQVAYGGAVAPIVLEPVTCNLR